MYSQRITLTLSRLTIAGSLKNNKAPFIHTIEENKMIALLVIFLLSFLK